MAANNGDEENLSNITDPRDSDVLCGRGGAALRHPGNQTYRRLVNLNKGLYTTCLKTEKLKISRSIVAAIREQNGRFLERDVKKGTWLDIGDKKAVEKTSQALREGQPKLRQKMAEMGQIPQDGNITMEHRFGNGIYAPRGNPGGGLANGGMAVNMGYGMYNMNPPQMQPTSSQVEMPPPPARALSNDPMNADALIARLSLSNSIPSWTPSVGSSNSSMRLSSAPPISIPSWTPSINSVMSESSNVKLSLLPPDSIPSWTPSVASSVDVSINRAKMAQQAAGPYGGNSTNNLGMVESSMSLMSQFGNNESTYGMEIDLSGGTRPGNGVNDNNLNHPGNPNNQMPPPPPPAPPMSPLAIGASPFDRRRLFARMKYDRPASSQRSRSTDGMSDINMVESNLSLMSDFSNYAGKVPGRGHGGIDSKEDGLPNFSDHSNGIGSRRSLMSGLSRISDTTGINSVFSDLSKKVSNSSTRSMTMSDFGDIQEVFNEKYESFNFEGVTSPEPTE